MQGLFVPADGELLGYIPTRSVISQEAAVNALMSQICAIRGLGPEDFLRNHPATDIITKEKKEQFQRYNQFFILVGFDTVYEECIQRFD